MKMGHFVGLDYGAQELGPQMPLTVVAASQTKPKAKPYKLFDGGGLFLLVNPSGSKHWKLAYRFNGVQKKLALGSFPRMSLAEARAGREAAKRQIEAGIDPSAAKRAAKELAKAPKPETSFEKIAREWHAWYTKSKKLDDEYAERIIRFLENDIFPASVRLADGETAILGEKDIATVEPLMLLAIIKKVEERDTVDLPRRLLGYCGKVFRYAIGKGLRKDDPSAAIKDHLAPRRRVVHRASFKERDLPGFFARLDAFTGELTTALALRFTMLTAVRTDEIRYGVWSEIEELDGKAPAWRIPPHRMKMKREHIVPLSRQAVDVLCRVRDEHPESQWLFPSLGSRLGIMSENAMLYALYRMGYHGAATVHGFRGTFSTILNEHEFNRDWVEMQLAHAEENDVRAAYNAAQWLTQRRAMLQWWADFLDEMAGQGERQAAACG
jgi:integrase